MRITVQKDTQSNAIMNWIAQMASAHFSFNIKVEDIYTVEDIQEVIRQCKLIEEELSAGKRGAGNQCDESGEQEENIQDK